MATKPGSQSLTVPVAAIGAAFAGALVSAIVAAMPSVQLAAIVQALGLADIVPMAAPPIGVTGRVLLALASGGAIGAIVWAVIVLGVGTHWVHGPRAEGVPVLRRADAHPDAPARRPIWAGEELGPPLPPVEPVEPIVAAAPAPLPEPGAQPLPRNLDVPLSQYDPEAIPAVPAQPIRPVPPMARPERMETFTLSSLPRDVPVPEDQPSLHALIDRLEKGATRRPLRAGHSVEETIGVLRRLAAH